MKTVKSSSWGAKLMGIGRTLLVATYLVSFGVAAEPALAQTETTPTPPAVPAAEVVSSTIQANQVIAATNQMRIAVGASALAVNSKLSRSAQMKAEDMATNSYFAHENAQGQRLAYWLGVVGYPYQYAGENLAEGFTSTASVMEGWKNSPGHYANIVKPEYREIGIGIASGMYQGRPVVFVVQHFGVTRDLVIPVANNVDLTVKPVFKPTVASDTASKPVARPVVTGSMSEQVANIQNSLPVGLNLDLVPSAYAGTAGLTSQPANQAGERPMSSTRALMLSITALLWLVIGAGLYIEVEKDQEGPEELNLTVVPAK